MRRESTFVGQWGLAMIAACALAIGAAGSVRAQTSDGDGRLAALEQAFWACDYIGTQEGVAEAPVEFCVEVTDDLRHEKFGGDFDAMVAWWQDNKAAEHAMLAAGALAGAREVPPARDGA